MKPHVVHIPRRFATASWGGTEAVVANLAAGQRRNGLEASIMTSMALDAVPVEEVQGVPVQRFAHFYPEWPLVAAQRATYDRKGGNLVCPGILRALGRQPKLSVVHLHTGNRLGSSCLRAARARGVPCLITLHGGHFTIPPAELSALTGDGRRPTLAWGKVLSWWWDTRRLLENVDAVVCVGEEEAEAARARLPGQRVCFIPGGVDVDRFAAGDAARGRALLGHDGARPLIACLARLDVQKDQETLVAAWAGLDEGADLALIGPETTPGYTARCQAAGAGAKGRLLLTGNLLAEAVPDVLAAADIVVLPSRHEPFGLACLEAWAAGRPVIATAIGGPARLLADGRGGVLIPVGDVAALRQRLAEALADPAQRAIQGAAGRAKAREGYAWERVVDRYRLLYEELIAQRGATRR